MDRTVETLHNPDFVRRVYPEGLPELREAIAAHYTAKYQVDTSIDHLIVDTGTSPKFRTILQLVSGRGREILWPRPYYELYVCCATLAQATVKFYNIDPDTKRADMDAFQRNFSPERTSLVVVNSPGNPIGNVARPNEPLDMHEVISRQAWILNDEIYNNCVFHEAFQSPLGLIPDYKDITIVTNSFSEGFRMYTKRVGFAIFSKEIHTNLRLMQKHTLLYTDACNQYGMIADLEDEESPAELSAWYSSRREYITR